MKVDRERRRETMPKRDLYPLIAIVLMATASCSKEEVEVAPALRPVRTHRVQVAAAAPARSLAGVTRSGLESRLSFRVPGTVEEVAVSLGDRVDRGQTLARLDPTDYELKVEEAEAALAQGLAALRKAEADYDRVRALYENNNASKAELDAARAAAESAEAQVGAVRKQLELAQKQVGYATLRAPVDGAIASVSIEINENVESGREVFVLTSGDVPEVAVAMPEGLIDRVRVGLPVVVKMDSLPNRDFDAEVSEVGVAAMGGGTTFEVVARLMDRAPEIRSGMAATVAFRFEERDDEVMRVPSVAVGEDRDGRFVFVVVPDGETEAVVERRAVEIGRFGEMIEIVAGLEPGELIATAGVRRLTDGMRVGLEQ